MGLFDKRDRRRRGRDEFESPIEQIDLGSTPRSSVLTEELEQASAATTAPLSSPPVQTTVLRAERVPGEAPGSRSGANEHAKSAAAMAAEPTVKETGVKPRPPEPGPPKTPMSYGIDKAIELMRSLPGDNVELVVQVVKHTLESTNIKLADIIADAVRKQDRTEERLKVLRSEIAELEKEIAVRQKEIETLNADYKETNTVRKQLELAENLCKNSTSTGNGKHANQAGNHKTSPPARTLGATASQGSSSRPGKPLARLGDSPLVTSSAKK